MYSLVSEVLLDLSGSGREHQDNAHSRYREVSVDVERRSSAALRSEPLITGSAMLRNERLSKNGFLIIARSISSVMNMMQVKDKLRNLVDIPSQGSRAPPSVDYWGAVTIEIHSYKKPSSSGTQVRAAKENRQLRHGQ